MATIDEILGGGGYHPNVGNPPKGSAEWAEQHGGEEVGNAPKGSEAWAEQHSGDNAPVSSSASSGNESKITPVAHSVETPAVTTTGSEPEIKKRPASGGGYAALLEKLMPKPMTQEELAKEEKKYKLSRFSTPLERAYRLFPISFSPRRAHRACTQAKTTPLKGQRCGMTR